MMLGCHVVGERAMEITHGGDSYGPRHAGHELVDIPLSFPTYAGILAPSRQAQPGNLT